MAETIRYTEDHEWVRIKNGVATVGITDHAQEQLGDIVFIDLPDVGKTFSQKEEAGVIESVKAASELYVPVSGEIVETNSDIVEDPSIVNADPMGKGWFVKIKMSDPAEFDGLMDEDAYKDHVG